MIELQKDDIPILDFIIDELCKTGVYFVTAKYLAEKKVFNFGNIKTVGDLAFKETDSKEFERLVGIIKKSGKAKVSEQLFENPLSVSRNSDTLHFQKLGGFKNEFDNLEQKKKRENVEFELAESNIRANKLNEKNSERNKRETIINIILGAINIGLLIWQIVTAE